MRYERYLAKIYFEETETADYFESGLAHLHLRPGVLTLVVSASAHQRPVAVALPVVVAVPLLHVAVVVEITLPEKMIVVIVTMIVVTGLVAQTTG